jgi:hypothetical protein
MMDRVTGTLADTFDRFMWGSSDRDENDGTKKKWQHVQSPLPSLALLFSISITPLHSMVCGEQHKETCTSKGEGDRVLSVYCILYGKSRTYTVL